MKILAVLFALANVVFAQGNTYVLKAAHLFDGVSGQLVSPGMVVVSNGTISSVGGAGPRASSPPPVPRES